MSLLQVTCLANLFLYILGPGTYSFGYEIDDPTTQNRQYRSEERLRNGDVRGSYGVLNADGTITQTTYVADRNGYRPHVERYEVVGEQMWMARGGQRVDDVRHRPSSPSLLSKVRSNNVGVLFAYPPITGEQMVHGSERYQAIQQNSVDDRTEATAAFPINSKLGPYFFTPEYLASVENSLHS